MLHLRFSVQSNTVTEIVEYDGAHLLPANPEWETIADYALDWP